MRKMTLGLATLVLGIGSLPWVGRAWSEEKATGDQQAAPEVTVRIADWQETLKLVESHKGKIVVLDAWSTSCVPCMKEFPHLVRLHKQYGGKGLVCMSMACDYVGAKSKPPEYYKERVLKFLTRQGATFQNILSNVPSDDLLEQMQLAAIPAVYVFGRDGKLVKRFDNEKIENEDEVFTYKDVTKLVEELLARKR